MRKENNINSMERGGGNKREMPKKKQKKIK